MADPVDVGVGAGGQVLERGGRQADETLDVLLDARAERGPKKNR